MLGSDVAELAAKVRGLRRMVYALAAMLALHHLIEHTETGLRFTIWAFG